MKLIENKNINGSTKIIRLKKEEVPGKAQQLLNHYQEGGIIVIEGFKPHNVNYSILQQCTQEPCSYRWGKKSIKKMYTKELLQVSKASEEIKTEILASERNIFKSVHKIFYSMLSYTSLKNINMTASSLWRCLPTIDEKYHVDVYPMTSLRSYWNLDDAPRVWGFGHSSLDVLQMFPEDPSLKEIMNCNAGTKDGFQTALNRRLNELSDGLGYHIAEFDPFDLWIGDGVKGFHKIIYGKKMLSLNFGPADTSLREIFVSTFGYDKWIKSRKN